MLILNPTVSGSFNLSSETSLTATSASIADTATSASFATTATSASFASTATSASFASTATSSSFAANLGADSVGYGNIANEFKSTEALTAAGSIDVNFSNAQIFTLTPAQNFTLNITNPRVGQTKFIVITGAGGSYGLSWTVGGSSGTFNRIAGAYNDTSSTKNFIQISCVSATEFWYSVSQIDS